MVDLKKFLPIVIDLETTGVDCQSCAVLEIATYCLYFDDGLWRIDSNVFHQHVLPFQGAVIDEQATKVHGIRDPWHPFRCAVDESKMLDKLNEYIAKFKNIYHKKRAIVCGHNVNFDLSFLNKSYTRCNKKIPFHHFNTIDTVSLGMYFYGENTLMQLAKKTPVNYLAKQAHSALYDAKVTADILIYLFNQQKPLQ